MLSFSLSKRQGLGLLRKALAEQLRSKTIYSKQKPEELLSKFAPKEGVLLAKHALRLLGEFARQFCTCYLILP